ncbi:tetratricopeptide repeat protein [Chryseobacterium indoltheticum]|uniref:Lipoprotein NlpI n=1 Tax=Chryseobacterium indoltheticum TaxID=254 RepID=A0A381F628_9FLAO|nr:tetratricopeptide repeat protein [Chryseobacterium indoltheticum]AZA72478.1 DUF2971 domain-containing protein [Chryseobacterium indoltheticum]SIQ84630.1 Tetratricopeptide repeat-containing protein [Chryseobacterium indoltheticum]SUX42049.1 lipoprotein NlpI [Chryseobacterium indoltheticum]
MITENKQELLEKVKILNLEGNYNEVINILTDSVLEAFSSYELYAEVTESMSKSNKKNYQIYAIKSLEISKNVKANFHLGCYFIEKENFEKAKKTFEEGLEIDPKNPLSYHGLGNYFVRKIDLESAKDCYKKALNLDPNFSNSYIGLAVVYQLDNDFQKSEELYLKALKINSKSSANYFNLAYLNFQQKKYKHSKRNYQRFIELESDKRKDRYYNIAIEKLEELNKILASEDYKIIKEIVAKIKKTLEYTDECVTHFTSISVTKLLIFEDSRFRLSEGAYLNDTSEGIELFSFLNYQSPFGRKENPVDEIFVQKPFIGSFVSENKHNDLTMWRMYGKEGKDEARGCALTMKVDKLREKIQKELGTTNLEENEPEIKFYKVAYWKDNKFIIPDEKILGTKIKNLNKYCLELKNAIEEFSKKDEEIKIQIDIEELLFEIAFLFKGIEYQYEHEIRLVQKGMGFDKIVDKNFIIPRVYIELTEVSESIKKITLGPKVERADEWASAFHYELKNKEIEAEIHISRQPFK